MHRRAKYIFSNLTDRQAGNQIFKSPNYLVCTFAYLIICTLFFSCAQIVSPTGGPKDVQPPKVLRYEPDTMPVNFNGKVIRLKFDEYIQLNDLQSQLIISPPMKKQPDINVKGKDVVMELNDTLKKNTTYTLNFGNAITDVTENNPIESFQYVFSTGTVIDSLSLSGSVKNAFTLAPEKGVLVMLYDAFDDSVPFKRTPSYFTKTKTDGSFKINYLRAGKYKIFALKDANANYLYDTPEELIAFKDTLVEVPLTKKVDLLMFKEEEKRQFVKKVSIGHCGDIGIILTSPFNNINLSMLSTNEKSILYSLTSDTKDTAVFWFQKGISDSLHAFVKADGIVLDTLKIKLKHDEIKMKLQTLTALGIKQQDVNSPFFLNFNLPISEIDKAKMELRIIDSTSKQNNIDMPVFVIGDKDKRIINIYPGKLDSVLAETVAGPTMVEGYSPNWKEGLKYKLQLLPGAFKSIYGTVNADTLSVLLDTRELKFYGTLKLKFQTGKKSNGLLQLYNQRLAPIKEEFLNSSADLYYEYLYPGNYSMRLINDVDKNQKWTTGNYLKHQQPEKVIYYPNPITIRSNWDLELEWKVD